jgi:CRP/FNR family transcriptional regulator, cyclic AMP receptor protein
VTSHGLAEFARHPFVRGLPAEHIAQLAARADPVEIDAGQRIFDEDGEARGLWLICSGRVALDLQVPGRQRVIVETLGPGDELGLSWLAPIPRWQFGAIAQLDVIAYALTSESVLALCDADHELGYWLTRRLLTTAISRLHAARIRILDLYAAPEAERGP